jgi:hypothetical protein
MQIIFLVVHFGKRLTGTLNKIAGTNILPYDSLWSW